MSHYIDGAVRRPVLNLNTISRRRGSRALGLSLSTGALVSAGANVIVPGSGPIVAVGAGVLSALFGGNKDAARLAREQWFEQAARQGSVLAARFLIGGTLNTASHEIPYYRDGINRMLANPQTAPTMLAAQAQGPYWDTTDNDQSDKVRALVETELEQMGQSGAVNAPGSSSSTGGYVPGAPTTTRPATSLPTMVSTAPFNYTPWLIAGGALLGGALLMRRR